MPRSSRFAFSAIVAAMLGFGATQAFAVPRAAAAVDCDSDAWCDGYCQGKYGTRGDCQNGKCMCEAAEAEPDIEALL